MRPLATLRKCSPSEHRWASNLPSLGLLTGDMKFARRSVRSKPGLTQEEALLSLQSDPSYRPGVDEITSLRRRGSRWVAELRAPKTAGPPPAFADEGPEEEGPSDDAPDGPPAPSPDEGPSDEGSPDDSGSEGPPSPDDGEKKEPGKEKKGDVEGQILQTLQAILHALGGGGPEGMGGPDALGPGPDGPAGPPPPAHAGPGHPPGAGAGPPGGGAPKPGRPMKPGEAPPGSTPVGAPAFASRQAAPVPGVPGAVPGGATPAAPGAGGACPQCGGPEPCPIHGASAINQPPGGPSGMSPVASLRNELAPMIGKAPTLTISTGANQPINEVVQIVREAVEPHGYQVKQAKRVDGGIRVLASVR